MRTGLLLFICLIQCFFAYSAQAADDFQTKTFNNELEASSDLILEDEFLPVEEAYILNVEMEQRNSSSPYARLNWQIAEGYYLYRHSLDFELKSGDQTIAITPQIPDGLEKEDEYFGRVQVYYHSLDIELQDIPEQANLNLSVTSQGCADAGLCYPPRTQHFQLDGIKLAAAPVEDTPDRPSSNNLSPNTGTTIQSAANADVGSLPYMLLLAALGGIILNLMPCVFPVLSLKVLGFANDKEHSQLIHGFSYSAGVVSSFIVVAGILVSLQAAGQAVGWGFHLQSPWFVAALCYLFFVMGLSLSGVVEFGGSWMNVGSSLANKSGYSGSFFTGVLATIVASPCTAPFMGTALGFAVTQPVVISLLVFAALGVGMALPVLVLSASPKLLSKIPKPGPWMDQLKQILAFPLYATAVWLCWVVGNQTGVNGMATILLGCVLLALAIWLWNGKLIKRSLSAASIVIALTLLASNLLQPVARENNTNSEWLSYNPAVLAALRDEGKPVFINVTADWCITCLTNEKVTLSTDRVKESLQQNGITYLKADWTNYDPTITALLSQYGRNGIPLYLVYPANSNGTAEVLPQILTVDTVVNAFSAATQATVASN